MSNAGREAGHKPAPRPRVVTGLGDTRYTPEKAKFLSEWYLLKTGNFGGWLKRPNRVRFSSILKVQEYKSVGFFEYIKRHASRSSEFLGFGVRSRLCRESCNLGVYLMVERANNPYITRASRVQAKFFLGYSILLRALCRGHNGDTILLKSITGFNRQMMAFAIAAIVKQPLLLQLKIGGDKGSSAGDGILNMFAITSHNRNKRAVPTFMP